MKGVWVWPTSEKEQSKVIKKVADDPRLLAVLKAVAKNKDGMSNPEVDEALGTNSDWVTIWTLRQLLALGFVDYRTDLFGEASKYFITELGKQVLGKISGQPPLQPQKTA
jgi:hypothetical protein